MARELAGLSPPLSLSPIHQTIKFLGTTKCGRKKEGCSKKDQCKKVRLCKNVRVAKRDCWAGSGPTTEENQWPQFPKTPSQRKGLSNFNQSHTSFFTLKKYFFLIFFFSPAYYAIAFCGRIQEKKTPSLPPLLFNFQIIQFYLPRAQLS